MIYEKLMVKILDILDRGTGGLLAPWQRKREGKADTEVRRAELLSLAQTERDIADVKAGRKTLDSRGCLITHEPALPTGEAREVTVRDLGSSIEALLKTAQIQVVIKETQRIINLKRIAIKAEKEAQAVPDELVSDTPLDDDWFERWRDYAQNIRNEDLQQLWARVLAGEAKQPGSFSLHTLDLLQRLSKDDAAKIEKLAPFDLSGWIWRGGSEYLDKEGLKLDQLMEFEELEILSAVEAIGFNQTVTSTKTDEFQNVILCDGKGLLIKRAEADASFAFPVYRVTGVGREILSLGHFTANEDYLRALGAFIKQKGFSVWFGDYQPKSKSEGIFSNLTEI